MSNKAIALVVSVILILFGIIYFSLYTLYNQLKKYSWDDVFENVAEGFEEDEEMYDATSYMLYPLEKDLDLAQKLDFKALAQYYKTEYNKTLYYYPKYIANKNLEKRVKEKQLYDIDSILLCKDFLNYKNKFQNWKITMAYLSVEKIIYFGWYQPVLKCQKRHKKWV